jgi:predicted nucleotidyltransferase
MELTKKQKQKIKKFGKEFNLKLIVLHGSYAKGTPRKGSDLDIAVLGKKPIEFEDLLKLHGKLADVFGDNQQRELDLKSLHGVDTFFRYQVMKDGVLLYGSPHDFIVFKVYAIRSHQENQKIYRLKEILLKKRQEHLEKLCAR